MNTATGMFEFYSETLRQALEGHARKHDTTVDNVLEACKYQARGELAFLPHYDEPYIHGDAEEYPFLFVDHKSRINREGRSANCYWYYELKSLDPGDEDYQDVAKINPDDAEPLGLRTGDRIKLVSPAGEIVGFYFLVTAVASSLAILLLATVVGSWVGNKERKEEKSIRYSLGTYLSIALGLTLLIFLLRIFRALSAEGDQMAGFLYMMGTLSFNFELLLGILLPLAVLLVARHRTGAQVAAAILVCVGMFAGRYEQLLSGNIMPMGVQAEGAPQFMPYTPSLYEWGLILFVGALVLIIYSLGERYLNLGTVPEEA